MVRAPGGMHNGWLCLVSFEGVCTVYGKLAVANVRRSVRDYSVYFVTLAFAACLLYLFTASGDYVGALDLTDQQRAAYGSAGQVIQAFSVFTVLVFSFLVIYANRFILRRRSGEFALYALLGMEGWRVAGLLALEGTLVGAGALGAGLGIGVLLTPLFGGVVSFVFGVPWRLVWVVSGDALAWTAGCFALVMALATVVGMRTVGKRSLLELLQADTAPDRPRAMGPLALGAQLVVGLILVGAVWAVCVVNPLQFVALVLPLGVVAVVGTCLVFRALAGIVPRMLRRWKRWYLTDVHCFVVRQVEAKVALSSLAMAWVCALVAVGLCMMVAGLVFSVGMRGFGEGEGSLALAPIGFVGILYGVTFLVAAAAILALQQLSEASDSIDRYRTLADLGTPDRLAARSVRAQVAVYFGAPLVGALIHAAFGCAVVGCLAEALGSLGFGMTVGAVVGITLGLMGLYYVVTCAACWRMVRR